MPTVAQITAAVVKFITASDKAYDIVNGPASGAGSTIAVTSGTIKSFAKLQADAEAAFALLGSPLELTSPPVNGTTSGTLGKIAIATIGGARQYSFRLVKVAGLIWEPATANVIWNDAPATGVARYMRLSFTGTGDDRTTFYEEL